MFKRFFVRGFKKSSRDDYASPNSIYLIVRGLQSSFVVDRTYLLLTNIRVINNVVEICKLFENLTRLQRYFSNVQTLIELDKKSEEIRFFPSARLGIKCTFIKEFKRVIQPISDFLLQRKFVVISVKKALKRIVAVEIPLKHCSDYTKNVSKISHPLVVCCIENAMRAKKFILCKSLTKALQSPGVDCIVYLDIQQRVFGCVKPLKYFNNFLFTDCTKIPNGNVILQKSFLFILLESSVRRRYGKL